MAARVCVCVRVRACVCVRMCVQCVYLAALLLLLEQLCVLHLQVLQVQHGESHPVLQTVLNLLLQAKTQDNTHTHTYIFIHPAAVLSLGLQPCSARHVDQSLKTKELSIRSYNTG